MHRPFLSSDGDDMLVAFAYMGVAILGTCANVIPGLYESTKTTPVSHTGASVAFAQELSEMHQAVTFDRELGTDWEWYAGLSAIEADLSDDLNHLLLNVIKELRLDPCDALAVIGA